MKTLKIRTVSSKKLSESYRDEFRKPLMDIPARLTVENKFATIPDVLDDIVLESDKDIDEQWLYSKIYDSRYHWCHLYLTDEEWEKAGIRSSLNGSSDVVKGTWISYGRWPKDKMALGRMHEGSHNAIRFFKMLWGLVHYHFYGFDKIYTEEEEKALKPKRYVRTPDPEVLWRKIPWETLPDIGVTSPPVSSQPILSMLPLVVQKQDLFIQLATMFIAPTRVTEGWRSSARQAELWAQGRTTPGPIVTFAKPGESMHEYGLAFDIAFKGTNPYPAVTDPRWQKLFDLAEVLGLESYGRKYNFDFPHFQYLAGYTEEDVRKGRVDYKKFN